MSRLLISLSNFLPNVFLRRLTIALSLAYVDSLLWSLDQFSRYSSAKAVNFVGWGRSLVRRISPLRNCPEISWHFVG